MSAGEIAPPRKPRQGDELSVRVDAIDARGRAVGRVDAYRVTLAHALPGALVRAKVLRRRRDQIDAIALETLEASPLAVEARCAHFGACGGCSFQDLAYEAQLATLHALVDGALRSKGLLADAANASPEHVRSLVDGESPTRDSPANVEGVSPAQELHELVDGDSRGPDRSVVVEPVVPAPSVWRYRNKMEFTFGNRRWIDPREPADAPNGFALGMHAKNLFSKVVDVRSCAIQAEEADAILASVRALALEMQLEPWDVRSHTGLVRHLVMRVSGTNGDVLVTLVTSRDAPEVVETFAQRLRALHPRITTFVHAVNSRAGATAIGESERIVFGPGFLRETLLGVEFRVSSRSFFQTNTKQAERLFEIVREECQLTGRERVWDLYCGTGTLTLVLASQAHVIEGFELVPEAIEDARANALANGITNATFEVGDVLDLARTAGMRPAPDVVVVDPPRAGLHPKVAPALADLRARRIVYVSCNPAAAANDVAVLVQRGYRLARVRPIDLFPHTPHVETVLRLERVS